MAKDKDQPGKAAKSVKINPNPQMEPPKQDPPPPERPRRPSTVRGLPSIVQMPKGKLKGAQTRQYFDEVYTDKDRAAAVSIGSFDIKQSLSQKRRSERDQVNAALEAEADPSALIALGLREIKSKNLDNGVLFLSKALEVNAKDSNALIARSNCYLQLGEPQKALDDAETALSADKSNIRAIYQKAEALYYLGQFEHSLMFFHRGLKLRPELSSFRLGIQKTQEAIENTIGPKPDRPKPTGIKPIDPSKPPRMKTAKARTQAERRAARKLLGELFVDKEYLESLLNHPDLVRADTKTENISEYAKDAINFLTNRQEFWRQQKMCAVGFTDKRLFEENNLPDWF